MNIPSDRRETQEAFGSNNPEVMIVKNESLDTRREFVQDFALSTAGLALGDLTLITDMLEDRGPTLAQKERLFQEQEDGYAKLLALSDAHEEGVEVLSSDPPVLRISYDRIAQVCGRAAAERAKAGGKKVMLCSEDRLEPSQRVVRQAKEKDAVPEDVPDDVMKAGYPGLGALLQKEERQAMYDTVRLRNDVVLQGFHEDCGACGGDILLAEQLSKELGENGLHAAMVACGYSEGCAIKMTGYPHFHHGLGLVIATSDTFAAERLPIARHMHLAAYLEPSDATLNMHVGTLYGILMAHGWGPERSRIHPIVILVAGAEGKKDSSARQTVERLQPTWQHLHEQFPGTFKVVAFDVPNTA